MHSGRADAAAVAVLVPVVVLAASCSAFPAATVPPLDCTKAALSTLYDNVLTIGTDQPAYPPWFIGDNPANGEGFESAVAYAVADKFGYADHEVRWVRVPFNTAMTPGPKEFDVNLSEFSITDQRRELVDFSTPYYDVSQAVVTVKTSAAVTATSLADLRSVKLGAQAGTTSSAAARHVGGNTPIEMYNTNIDAKMALRSGQIDALVLDMPTAVTVQSELDGGIIIGRLPQWQESVEQFGIVLDKNSQLTPCVSRAVDELRTEGVLQELEAQWLAEGTLPPVLG